jgi:hypothetical protein
VRVETSMRSLMVMAFQIWTRRALATRFLRPRLAPLMVGRFTLRRPDEVGDLEGGVFMAANLPALIACWLGWLIGGRLLKPVPTPT